MYPFMINIANKKIVVIGGGKIAAKRVHSMLPWQPHITVVSPTLDESLLELVTSNKIRYMKRNFQSSDVEHAFIVIAATNNSNINQIVKDSCSLNQLVNLADDPQKSSFHFPAFYEKEDITVAVSTNGISPSLSMKLRDDFAAIIDDFAPDYIEFLKEVRTAIKHSNLTSNEKRTLLSKVLEDQYRHDIAARTRLKEQLYAAIR
jgi:precorrin-2 dehydrogenase / sirohydrochlorin ferrochelatase